MRKVYSSMDLISLGVSCSGMLVTLQNTALTLFVTHGFVKGGIFMVVTLLVVGACGMMNHSEMCYDATVRI